MLDEIKFTKLREEILSVVHEGIKSNINLANVQKKYLKNLLLFALLNAERNETVTGRNFIKLVNRLFKKFIIDILKNAGDDEDDEDLDENLTVELNRIIANAAALDLDKLQARLTPTNIINIMKLNTNGMSQRQILNHLLSLRNAKSNYRETPEEARKREQRQKEYEMAKKRERMMAGRLLDGRGSREL